MHRAFTLTIALLVGATTAACGGSADQESDTGGVVVRDIHPGVTAVGNPARPMSEGNR